MRWFDPRTLVAAAGSVAVATLPIVYLTSRPGRPSAAVIVLLVATGVFGLGLFFLFLSRLTEQVVARRFDGWIRSPEGEEWLASLPSDERERFEANYSRLK